LSAFLTDAQQTENPIVNTFDFNNITTTTTTTTKTNTNSVDEDALFSNRITIVIILSIVLALFLIVGAVLCIRNCLSSKRREQEKQLVRANTKLNSKISRGSAASVYQPNAGQARPSFDSQVSESKPIPNAQLLYIKNSDKAVIQSRNPAKDENELSIKILNEIADSLEGKKNNSIRFDIVEDTLEEEETENDVSSTISGEIMHL
jgi:hypothetical protein